MSTSQDPYTVRPASAAAADGRALEHARALDAADPLAALRGEFVIDPESVYLDGNSLGRLPHSTARRLRDLVDRQWGHGLIRSWEEWIDLPVGVGDLIGGHLLGAAPGQTVLSDSTSVNFYKLAAAALAHQARVRPGRGVIVTDDDNFPTDRYILEGLAEQHGMKLRVVRSDPVDGPDAERLADAIGADVALVSFSHVAYRSGALLDMAAINELSHRAGALVLWDLSHSVGSVPVHLDGTGTDLAVGCTYKYLNGGPGAPAFLYVRRDLISELRQPVQGWFSQLDQFAMGPRYEPLSDIRRFLAGTPNAIGCAAVEEGVKLLVRAGMRRLRDKSVALTDYLIALADAELSPLGFELASPRDAGRRGAHVSLAHPDAYRISRAYAELASVIPDFRAPDRLRLGPAPIYTGFEDVFEAVRRLRDLVGSGALTSYDAKPSRIS